MYVIKSGGLLWPMVDLCSASVSQAVLVLAGTRANFVMLSFECNVYLCANGIFNQVQNLCSIV